MSITIYLRYQYGVKLVNFSVFVHSHNSNKQHLTMVKFYTNNALFIGIRSAKF